MVSVIIPVYNGENYIARCLDSLLSADTKDIEVIAVNDGSRDLSSKILHSYAERFPCLKVIDKENGGAASARQKGLSEASGEYVAFLDIDDYVEPNIYKRLLKKAQETDADIVFCDYIEEKGDKKKHVKNIFDENEKFPIGGERAIEYLHTRLAVFPFPWNKIYKASLMSEIDFPQGNFVGEDYYMLLRLFGIADKIEYLPEVGYHYILTENSASRTGYSEATLRAYENFKEDYRYVCERYPHMQVGAANYVITEYMACVIAMGRNKTYNKSMIKEIKAFIRKNLFSYLKAPYISVTLKGSAAAICVSYKLLILAYRIIK